jgi:hypothetical protein
MTMLGSGCFVAWYDVRPGHETEHDHWHTHEHIIERVAIPGFRRGLRYRSLIGSPRLCIIYQADSLQTFASPAYLERLNNPTPWTAESMPLAFGVNRTMCNVVSTHGHGIGGYLVSVQVAPRSDHAEHLKDWLTGETMPALAARPGLCGAHLLIGDPEISQIKTQEKEIRGDPDAIADWVILVEGYDRIATEQALAELRGSDGLVAHHAVEGLIGGLYSLDYMIDEVEAKRVWRSR